MRGQGGHSPGKLEQVARQWAGGRSSVQEVDQFDAECRAFGLDPEAVRWAEDAPSKDVILIWPCMADSVALFFAVSTQWRWTGAGMAGAFRTGLDYTILRPTAKNIRVKMTPTVFDDIRTLEREALSVWSRK